jgi:hypothetical protein
MFCSGCGHALIQGQPVCPQCGRPVVAAVPPIPGMAFLVDAYAGKIKTLGVFWFVYAGLSLLTGFAGMAAFHLFSRHFGSWNDNDWANAPFGPWFWPAIAHLLWVKVMIRVALALAAGWGLMERAPWGRIVALVAAFWNILHFPFGTALAVFTLVLLLGYRNNALYSQLPRVPVSF